MEKYGIIYKITNNVNRKVYIGQTIRSLEKRWKDHLSQARRYNSPLQRAIRKYGKENFTIEVICECVNQEDLDKQECSVTKQLNTLSPCGYNLIAGNGKGNISEETRIKLSESHSKEKSHLFGKTGYQHPVFGTHHTDETKKKMSDSKLKDKNPMFGKTGSNHHLFGKKHTDKTKIKIAATRKTKTYFMLSPYGERIVLHNMKKFCRENNLNPGNMFQVALGKKKHHKGWTKDPNPL